jgi:putative nucleotidyltransferase with HDIG domain
LEKLQQYLHRARKMLDITFFRVLFFVILGTVLYAFMFSNVKPEKINLPLFSIADKTIRSPITIEDMKSTEEKRKEAVSQVKDVYIQKKEYTQNRVDVITSIFDSAVQLNDEIKAEVKKQEPVGNNTIIREPTVTEKITRLKSMIPESVEKELSDQDTSALVQADKSELSIAKDLTITAINNVMSKRISAEDVENAKKGIDEGLKYSTLNSELKRAAIDLGRIAVIQNEFYDSAATKEFRKQAEESVEPVKILQGQIIVEEGELVSRETLRQLKLAGLLDNTNTFKPFIGLALFVIIFITAIYYYFYQMNASIEKKQTYMLLFGIVFTLSILIMKAISLMQPFDFPGIGYLFPAAMGGMLIKILIDEKLAILTAVIMAVCGSLLFNEGLTGTLNFSEGIYILSSALAGILYLSNQNHRSKILWAGLFSSGVNLVTILALLFLSNGQLSGTGYLYHFSEGLGSGILSAVLTIGLLPFFEASFGILSTMKLIELSNPNHPLLRKILIEAPGTYHHSVMVANLAESACEAIGGNGLLARVGCYYHDIGKTMRPNFFIENQMNRDNPHDRLSPEKSTEIITAHVSDGIHILKRFRMPKEIVDIAEQHHGTTLLKYFYYKAQQGGQELKEEDFRYPGPKAQTKEAAIVGIADSVEAAVRSLSDPTTEQIEKLVKTIIVERLEDGQLNECDLTLKELETISFTLCETIKGIFHSRIEYPEFIKQKVRQA